MRSLTITESGISETLVASNGVPKEWVLSATGGINGSTNMALQASMDGDAWFAATDVNGPVIFTAPEAVLVSPGLYYRVNVGVYTSPIQLTIKPS